MPGGNAERRTIMRNVIHVLPFVGLLCIPCLAEKGPRIGTEKKIIKTGQDMPNAKYCREHIREMERWAFDGVTIDLDANIGGKRERLTYRWWAPQEITRRQVQDSIDDLKATEFKRFTDNFLWISTQSMSLPAPSWLDDEGFAKIEANMALAAQIAKECGLKGIFLDVEQYGGMKWSPWRMRFCYPYAHANEVGAVKKNHAGRVVSFEEYAAAARKRGREIMAAMRKVYPDITILVLPGLHHVAEERIGCGARYCPHEKLKGLASSDCGLLAAFGDGLMEGMSPRATLVDGFEDSYAYTRNARFVEGRREIEKAASVSVMPELYRKRMKIGFGLMIDNRARFRGGFHTQPGEFIYNHFTPREWSNALYFALLNSDEYVWIWNQTNGAIFWKSPRFPKVKPNVPKEYAQAIEIARNPRDMNEGRDEQAALAAPIPESAMKLPDYSDEKTFGPLRDKFEIVGDLPKDWLFLQDEEALGIGYYTAMDWDDSKWETIRIGEYFQRLGHRFRGIAWYRCWFDLPAELKGKRVYLLFGGIDSDSIFVNGRWLGPVKEKGVTIQDFTKVARFGQKNLVCVWIITAGTTPAGIYKSVKLAVKK